MGEVRQFGGLSVLFFSFFFLSPTYSASAVQMVFEENVAPDLKVILTIVGEASARKEAQEAFQKASQHARDVLDRLDPLDPSGEVFNLMNQNTKGTFPVSPDLAKILSVARDVASRLKEPLARQIDVDVIKNEVTLKSADILINIEPLLKGYLADVIIEDMNNGGWHNVLLGMEGITIAKGEDFNGPWKVLVTDNTTANAQHAFYYKALDVAAATVNSQEKNWSAISSDLKSVTVFTPEGACKAQGLATAAYVAGLNNAKKILKISGATRSVLIDQNGNFVQIPEVKKQ